MWSLYLLCVDRFAAAELDCSVALTLDPLYAKAYMRRMSARIGLKKFERAKADGEKVLQLEPQNKKVKSDLIVIEKVLKVEFVDCKKTDHIPYLSHHAYLLTWCTNLMVTFVCIYLVGLFKGCFCHTIELIVSFFFMKMLVLVIDSLSLMLGLHGLSNSMITCFF